MEKYLINPNHRISKINKDIYGHFSEHLGRCIYEGLFVGKNSKIENINGMRCDVVNALKDMKIPVLRWPGGCFADEYHWKDGIGETSSRKKMINTHWGGVVEDNSFGTHEFMELCSQLGCDAYVNGNLGSGTVQEMSEWIEYMTFGGVSPMSELRKKNGREEPWNVKYFCVGNENWGCGGNMTPEYYANLYRRYQTYVRDYDKDKRIFRIACGPNAANYEWTNKVLQIAGDKMNGLSLHYYTDIRSERENYNCSATGFGTDDYYAVLKRAYKIEEIVSRHISVMNARDPLNKVKHIVDEWGTWYDVEPGTNPGFLYQQNTMRDAIVAGLTLNIFNKHSERIQMANIAQLVNVLQSVILTDGEKMLLTPTYYIFKMYADHQNNVLLGSYITGENIGSDEKPLPKLIESSSVNSDGEIISTIVNTSADESADISCQIADTSVKSVKAEILNGSIGNYNTFDNKDEVKSKEFKNFNVTSDGFNTTLPPCSVTKFVIA